MCICSPSIPANLESMLKSPSMAFCSSWCLWGEPQVPMTFTFMAVVSNIHLFLFCAALPSFPCVPWVSALPIRAPSSSLSLGVLRSEPLSHLFLTQHQWFGPREKPTKNQRTGKMLNPGQHLTGYFQPAYM